MLRNALGARRCELCPWRSPFVHCFFEMDKLYGKHAKATSSRKTDPKVYEGETGVLVQIDQDGVALQSLGKTPNFR